MRVCQHADDQRERRWNDGLREETGHALLVVPLETSSGQLPKVWNTVVLEQELRIPGSGRTMALQLPELLVQTVLRARGRRVAVPVR